MAKNQSTPMTSVITVEKATKEFPQLLKNVKDSKKRYFLSLQGRPQAVVLGFDDYLRSILQSKRSKAVTRIQEAAKVKGQDKLTLKAINTEISAYRKTKK
ncbi:MAG: hypothetical protein V3W51_03895 [Candidatus Brocadiales bacterium]